MTALLDAAVAVALTAILMVGAINFRNQLRRERWNHRRHHVVQTRLDRRWLDQDAADYALVRTFASEALGRPYDREAADYLRVAG